MGNVTKKYQVTIPRKVREDLKIKQGDKILFVKNNEENWIIMTVEDLTTKMIKSSSDIKNSNKKPSQEYKIEAEAIRIK